MPFKFNINKFMTYLYRSIFLPNLKNRCNNISIDLSRRLNMTIYREFETKEKSMEEVVKEIIKRYIMLQHCNLFQIDIECNKQGV